MKKILVVLLILAVGTGVFAQGTWTIGGNAEITSRINFDDVDAGGDTEASISSNGYHIPYDWYGPTKGSVNVGYSLGNFGGSVTIDSADGFMGEANVTGENYRFQFGGNLHRYFNFDIDPSVSTHTRDNSRFSRLWGEYKLINGMLTLEAAYNSRDTEYWVSDKTGTFGGSLNFDRVHHNFGNGDTFTKVDHHNYLLGNVTVSGLELGLMMPNVFQDESWTNDGGRNKWPKVPLIEGVLKESIFGAKFLMSPIEVAMQFKMQDYGVYLGGKFLAGPVTVGLSFTGLLDTTIGTHIKAGLSADYNAGAFGANIGGKFEVEKLSGEVGGTTISVEPGFFYNAIPTHLQFKLNAGFYFITPTTASGATKADMEVTWGVQPQIFWNFLGTGAAGDYWGLNTGMIVRYRIFRDVTNALDLVFKFAL